MDHEGLALCRKVVRAFAKSHPDADEEDLMQEAYIALLEGVKSYDDEQQMLSLADFIRPLIVQSLEAYCNEMAPLPTPPLTERPSPFDRLDQVIRPRLAFNGLSKDALNIETIKGRNYCRFMDPSRFGDYAAWVQKHNESIIVLDEQGAPQGILTWYDRARGLMFKHPGTDSHRLTPDEFIVCGSYRNEAEQSNTVIIVEHKDETPVAAYMGMIWEKRMFDKNYRAPLKMKPSFWQI